MVRGRSLSDENVITFVNQNFVAYDLNCNYGFPTTTPALAKYQRFYDRFHTPNQGEGTVLYSRGFTKSVVMSPDGSTILSETPNASVTEDWRNNANYNSVGYLQFLKAGFQLWGKVLESRATLSN